MVFFAFDDQEEGCKQQCSQFRDYNRRPYRLAAEDHATNHIADSICFALVETEERINTLELIKQAAIANGNTELAKAAESLIADYKDKQTAIATEVSNAFVGWGTNKIAEATIKPYKLFKDAIGILSTINTVSGLESSAEAHQAATYGTNIEYSIMLGNMADIEMRQHNGESISDDEWREYYILAEYVYNSRINQIDAILNGYVDGTEKTRLAHARNVLQDGLEEIKRQQAKYEVK